jgi:hypothetical protein
MGGSNRSGGAETAQQRVPGSRVPTRRTVADARNVSLRWDIVEVVVLRDVARGVKTRLGGRFTTTTTTSNTPGRGELRSYGDHEPAQGGRIEVQAL